MLPVWVYFAASFAIALLAFGIGQIAPGLGVPFVVLGSTIWAAYSARLNQRKFATQDKPEIK